MKHSDSWANSNCYENGMLLASLACFFRLNSASCLSPNSSHQPSNWGVTALNTTFPWSAKSFFIIINVHIDELLKRYKRSFRRKVKEPVEQNTERESREVGLKSRGRWGGGTKKRDLAEMLRESVAVAGGDHRCFNALISMPGLLPPLSMSRFSLLLLKLISKGLGKAAAPRGHVPPLRGDLRQMFVKPQRCPEM